MTQSGDKTTPFHDGKELSDPQIIGRARKSILDSARKRILIVDNEAFHRMTLRAILEDERYRCEEAVNGTEALDLLLTHPFDLLITDLAMPEINGLQLLKLMAEQGLIETTPVIVMTGELSETTRSAALRAGAQAVIAKPYNLKDLFHVMEDAMQ